MFSKLVNFCGGLNKFAPVFDTVSLKFYFFCMYNISEVSVTKIYMKFIHLICFSHSNYATIKAQFDVLIVYIQID